MNEGTINAEVTMGGAMGVLLVNRYRVLKQLGQGGMGSVWLAEDTKLDGRKVAVKMLPSILVSNKRAYAQVKQEALVSLKLTHPNIVAVRAFEEEGGNPFLVMDYIEGQTLDDYLAEKGKLSEEETICLLKPIAAALDYAHGQGVVHRDVKPGNIMIRKDGTPFVLDFGIAREIQETMTRVTGKLSSGTLLYMSPEQLNGDAPKPAQDVFSFAAMAYECLTGSPPFTRGGIEDQIKHKTPEALGPQFIKCGQGVMAGLAKSSESRPVTCAAVLSVGSRVPRDRAGDGAAARRTRIAAVLLGALAILSLVGVGGWLWREKVKNERIDAALVAFDAKDYEKGWQLSLNIRDADPRIQFAIGECYSRGCGGVTLIDVEEALKWFRKSAEQGLPVAQYKLGRMYEEGNGVDKDYVESVRWYRRAADQGLASAQCCLGYMYDTGRGVVQSYSEAVKWYMKSAAQGFARGQCNLGVLYSYGRGVEKDYNKAFDLFVKSARNGYATAQFNLGCMFEEGLFVKKDDGEAVKWYQKAADQGEVDALYNLAGMYRDGKGVARDMEMARRLFVKASDKGSARAKIALDRLESK